MAKGNPFKTIFFLVLLLVLLSVADFFRGFIGLVPIIGGLLGTFTNNIFEILQGMIGILTLFLVGRYMK